MVYIPTFLKALGLDSSADERTIRQAYARQLKRINPEADPAQFQKLRSAYETALNWAKHQKTASSSRQAASSEAPLSPTANQLFNATAPQCIPTVQTEPPITPTRIQSPNQLAEEVFRSFISEVKSWQAPDSTCVSEALGNAMKDPRLASLNAQHCFEGLLVEFLARPPFEGRQLFLAAAADRFGWSKDRKRLDAFENPGRKLNHEIDLGTLGDGPKPKKKHPPKAPPVPQESSSTKWLFLLFAPMVLALLRSFEAKPLDPPPIRTTTYSTTQEMERRERNRPPIFSIPPSPPPPGLSPYKRYDLAATIDFEKYMSQGRAHFGNKKYTKAIETFTQAIGTDPSKAVAYTMRGQAFLKLQMGQAALTDFSQSVRLEPRNAMHWYYRGLCHKAMGRLSESKSDLSEAIRLNPTYALAYLERGFIQRAKGLNSEADLDIDEAIHLDPSLKALATPPKANVLKGVINPPPPGTESSPKRDEMDSKWPSPFPPSPVKFPSKP